MAEQPDSASRDATPSVLAVVVAHDPGDWFDETLESLATQDYPRLSVLVVDASGDSALGGRVQAVLPDATLLDAADTEGFSAAANAVLDTDADPAFLLICHDDVALGTETVRHLVAESLRSNAGIAGPKLVDWDHPTRLQHVAYNVDRFAVAIDVIDPGELDQEQFDAVGDVFALPSACLLIRTGLFRTLGGFDEEIGHRGEEIDFCWRAHLLGARVMVVPNARVRHRDDLYGRTAVDNIRRTRARHQLRTVLITNSRLSLLLTLPLMMALAAGEAAVALFSGRVSHVRDVASAWTWNLRRLPEIRARRKELHPLIRARHADVRASQQAGSVRINSFVRGQIGRRSGESELRSLMRTGTARIAVLVAATVVLFVLFGSRTLISEGVPAVGQFLSFGDSGPDLLSEWWNGWRHRDLGSPGTPSTSVAIIGATAWLLGGSLGFVRLLWVVAPVLVGLVGAWRMLSVTGSRRAQTGALVAYALMPLPWVSISIASSAGLYGYAAAPWLLAALLHGQAASPYRSASGPWRKVLSVGFGLGVTVGLAGIFEPAIFLLVLPIVAGVLLAALVTGHMSGTFRLLSVLGIAAPVAALLSLPQLLDQLAVGFSWTPFAGGRSGGATALELVDVIGFAVGPEAVRPFTLLLVVPLALPLFVGRSWRFALAARGWFVALVSWGAVWAASWGVIPFGLPDPALLLAPAAAGIALTLGAAVAAAEHDMRTAGFGWRQALLPLAMVAAFLGSIPTLSMAEDGRWGLPRGGFEATVPFSAPETDGSYRVLWVAQPAYVPGGGHALTDTLSWSLTLDGLPVIADQGVPADDGSAALVDATLQSAFDGDTMRLGRTLGGLGIRYIVVLDRLAPAPFSEEGATVAANISASFGRQLDLQHLEGINSAMNVYVNTEWTSVRAAGVDGFDDGRQTIDDLAVDPLTGTAGVLPGRTTDITGPISDGVEIYVAQTNDTRWHLTVDGERTGRRQSLDWATAFVPDSGGMAALRYDSPIWRQGALVVQLVALFTILGATVRRRLGSRS